MLEMIWVLAGCVCVVRGWGEGFISQILYYSVLQTFDYIAVLNKPAGACIYTCRVCCST